MEYINEITINEAIIHILDNNSEEPILNEYLLELNDEVYNFLLKHIQRILKDEELKYAIFNDERNIIKDLSQEYLNGENNLIYVSKELSKQMFKLMKSNGNISSCDLITISIVTEYGPMIGILKMDYVKNYIHDIEFKEEKLNIEIKPQCTGLPASSQKIQKAVFIKKLSENLDVHLMVLDKKKKSKSEEEYGSNYFVNNYLGCTIITNERDETKNFLNATEEWTRNNLNENADRAEKLRRKVKDELKNQEEININEFSTQVFKEDNETKEEFLNFIKEGGIEEKINVDKKWVEKKFKRIRLKIDKDIDIYINEETYNDVERFQVQRNGDGTINIVLKDIRNYIQK